MIKLMVGTKANEIFETKKDSDFEYEYDDLKVWLREQGKPCLIVNTGYNSTSKMKTFIPLENVDFITLEECDD